MLIKYGRKHLFNVSITTSFILLTSSTNADEPLPNLPALSIKILSKSFPIPIACILNLLEFVDIKFMHTLY